MKLKQWLFGVTALSMLAACSDKDIAPGTGGENTGNGSISGISYLGVSLELPSEAGTRAGGENDIFDDGLAKEYEVDHAAILLFRGATEASAKFIGAYQLGTDQAFDQPNGDQITVSFQKTIKVLEKPDLTSGESLWGLAIVNYSEDIFSINTNSETDSKGYGSLTVKTADNTEIEIVRVADATTEQDATTFSTFRTYVTNSKFIRTKGGQFFMTNAPLSDKPGTLQAPTGVTIQTLSKLEPYFEKSQTEAEQNPAGCIFVERAVAKITLSKFPTTVTIPHTKVSISDSGTPSYENEDYVLNVVSAEWVLDNEEPTSYIVRNAQTSDQFWQYAYSNRYRFIGNASMSNPDIWPDPNNDHIKYRSYWCVDPTYTGREYNQTEAEYTALEKGTNTYTSKSAFYPKENTFDVAHQNYKNTTRVVFKVKYESASDKSLQLYALRGQLQTFYLPEDAQMLLERSVLGSTRLHNLILKYKKDAITSLPYSASDFNIHFGTAETAEGNGNGLVDTDKGIMEGDFVITGLEFTDKFMADNFKDLDKEAIDDISTELTGVAAAANQANHIVAFKDNTCYYTVYLKHFGDTYCPLPNGWTGDSVNEVYANTTGSGLNHSRYLGRYGLVRNNWYELSIDDIKRLGNANVPDGNVETSDDNKTEEFYLSARVHILSWAKRTQNVEF